jgi:hypothetical protein
MVRASSEPARSSVHRDPQPRRLRRVLQDSECCVRSRMPDRENVSAKAVAKDRADRISDYHFRHGRTTHLVEKTGNIFGAGFLVGHKHATTTNTYLHARSSMAKSVLAMVAGTDAEDPHLIAIIDDGSAAHQLVQTLSASSNGEPKTAAEPRIPSQYRRTHRSAGSAPSAPVVQVPVITSVRGTGLEPAHLAVPEPKTGARSSPCEQRPQPRRPTRVTRPVRCARSAASPRCSARSCGSRPETGEIGGSCGSR